MSRFTVCGACACIHNIWAESSAHGACGQPIKLGICVYTIDREIFAIKFFSLIDQVTKIEHAVQITTAT